MVCVLSEDGVLVQLSIDEEELMGVYSSVQGGLPEKWQLPFSVEEIELWNLVHSEGLLSLRENVSHILEYLGAKYFPLVPMEHQKLWISQMDDMLEKYGILIDTSNPGLGKTYMQCLIGQRRAKPLLVIAPAGVIPVWEAMRPALTDLTIVSYESLRGKSNGVLSELKHGLLKRIDMPGKKAQFFPTDKLKKLCEDGLLIVIDEISKIKNKSAQQGACSALVRTARRYDKTFVSLLSGSPFDKVEHCENLMRTLGYIEKETLIEKDKLKIKYTGLGEMLDTCNRFSPAATRRLFPISPRTSQEASEVVWSLYKAVIQPLISGGCSAAKTPYSLQVSNSAYKFSEEKEKEYKTALESLQSSVLIQGGEVVRTDFGGITHALSGMESSAAEVVAREALYRMKEEGSQVLIFCTYLQTYTVLHDLISPHQEVGIMNGSTNMKERVRLQNRFQSGELRILILGLRVGGMGLSFHDLVGGRKRYSYIFPSWDAIFMYQAIMRVHRTGVMSDSECEIVYCSQHPVEKLMQSLYRKSGVMFESANYNLNFKHLLGGDLIEK